MIIHRGYQVACVFINGAQSVSAQALVSRIAGSTTLGLGARNPAALMESLGLDASECSKPDTHGRIVVASSRFPLGLEIFECDATRLEDMNRAMNAFTGSSAGTDQGSRVLDGYVHFPGSLLLKPAHATKLEEWEEILRVNLTSAFIGLKAALIPMRKQGSGSLVFLSSVAATRGLPSHEAIAAAKAGIEGMVRSAAASYPNLRVNCVAPGLTATRMTQRIVASESALQASLSLNAIKRPGTGNDIAAAVEFLLGEGSGFVTGQVIAVDGGMSTLGFPRV
jgi:NAD(P)-dependent dehydrogenase (short-subunit alcohol dehydrogenase family)